MQCDRSLLLTVLLSILAVGVTNFKANETGETWATLTWTATGTVYSYKLDYRETDGPVFHARPSRSATKYTLTGLKPGTTYTVTLTPFSMIDQGQVGAATVLTCGGRKFRNMIKI